MRQQVIEILRIKGVAIKLIFFELVSWQAEIDRRFKPDFPSRVPIKSTSVCCAEIIICCGIF